MKFKYFLAFLVSIVTVFAALEEDLPRDPVLSLKVPTEMEVYFEQIVRRLKEGSDKGIMFTASIQDEEASSQQDREHCYECCVNVLPRHADPRWNIFPDTIMENLRTVKRDERESLLRQALSMSPNPQNPGQEVGAFIQFLSDFASQELDWRRYGEEVVTLRLSGDEFGRIRQKPIIERADILLYIRSLTEMFPGDYNRTLIMNALCRDDQGRMNPVKDRMNLDTDRINRALTVSCMTTILPYPFYSGNSLGDDDDPLDKSFPQDIFYALLAVDEIHKEDVLKKALIVREIEGEHAVLGEEGRLLQLINTLKDLSPQERCAYIEKQKVAKEAVLKPQAAQ